MKETLEVAAAKHFNKEDLVECVNIQYVLQSAFINGAKYMQEQMYNEIDIEVAFYEGMNGDLSFSEWLEQFKKK